LEGTFRGHLAQPSCSELGHVQLDQVAQSPVQLDIECFQGWRICACLCLSILKQMEFRMFVLCSLFLYDFQFSPKLREMLNFFSSPEVIPDGAVFSQLTLLTE